MNRIQRKIVLDALDNEELLSEWEFDFVSDLADRGDDYPLSPKQNEALNRIGSKVALGYRP